MLASKSWTDIGLLIVLIFLSSLFMRLVIWGFSSVLVVVGVDILYVRVIIMVMLGFYFVCKIYRMSRFQSIRSGIFQLVVALCLVSIMWYILGAMFVLIGVGFDFVFDIVFIPDNSEPSGGGIGEGSGGGNNHGTPPSGGGPESSHYLGQHVTDQSDSRSSHFTAVADTSTGAPHSNFNNRIPNLLNPVDSPDNSPVNSPENSPLNSPHNSPVNSRGNSPVNYPDNNFWNSLFQSRLPNRNNSLTNVDLSNISIEPLDKQRVLTRITQSSGGDSISTLIPKNNLNNEDVATLIKWANSNGVDYGSFISKYKFKTPMNKLTKAFK